MQIKMTILLVITIFFITFSCNGEKYVVIRAKVDGKYYEKKVPEDIEEFLFVAIHNIFEKIEGLEKLPNLKKLCLGPGIEDLLFLEKVPDLEYLVLSGCVIRNFDFLNTLSKLKILYVNVTGLNKNEIDLSYNNNLIYIALHGMHVNPPNNPFVLNIKNIPDSLKYLDLSMNLFLIINEDFLSKIERVPNIILDEEEYIKNKEYFDKHPNFIFKPSNEVLPKEYRDDVLLERPKYSIF